MVTRRQGREWALQMLCQLDLNPCDDIAEALAAFWRQQKEVEAEAAEEDRRLRPVFADGVSPKVAASRDEIMAFAEDRVRGVMERRDELDRALEPFLDNWSFYRLGLVERNALRIAAWELKFAPDIPAPIVINEAVDLTKYFSETKSGRFVNGVLDRYAKKQAAASETFEP